MNQQCLDRRIPNEKILIEELEHWQVQRNKEKASINWMFDVEKVREKLNCAYDKLIGQISIETVLVSLLIFVEYYTSAQLTSFCNNPIRKTIECDVRKK
jgi:hypothetical protein